MKGIALFAGIGLASLALTGCVVVTDAPPETASGVAVTQPHANGRPVNLDASKSSAFWIWHDGGGHWRLRSTSGGTRHRFSGTVSGHREAKIVNANSVSKEHDDKVKFVTDRVNFDFQTVNNSDGFNFDVQGKCVDFNIQIDGTNQPAHIVIGQNEQRPQSATFTACP